MKRGVVVVLLSLLSVFVLIIFVFPKTGFVTQSIDPNYLEELRLKAGVECLQDSQCSNDSECIGNICVEKKEIDLCQKVNLSTGPTPLRIGGSINMAKRVLTGKDLPYLLSDGKLVEIVKGEVIEYLYSPILLIGNNKIEKENQDYLIKNNEPPYTYKLAFSKPIDFSNKNLQGQTLRIFGEEYIISSNSDDSNLYLVSDKGNIKLQNKDNIQITKDENRKVLEINIISSTSNILKVSDNLTESTFNVIKLSFNSADDTFADVKIGGTC